MVTNELLSALAGQFDGYNPCKEAPVPQEKFVIFKNPAPNATGRQDFTGRFVLHTSFEEAVKSAESLMTANPQFYPHGFSVLKLVGEVRLARAPIEVTKF